MPRHPAASAATAAQAVFAATILIAGAYPAAAADCLGLGPAGTPAEIRVIRPGPRVTLLRNGTDRADCPAESAACRTNASFGPNNRVVVGATSGAFSCASRTDVRGHVTAGWIPTAALAGPPPAMPHRAADWTGSWHSGSDRRLRITATLDGAVALLAESTLPPPIQAASARSPAGAAPRRLAATLRPDREGDDTAFTLAEDGSVQPDDPGEGEMCRMTLARRGPYLVVQDNGLCGAAFTALYRRG